MLFLGFLSRLGQWNITPHVHLWGTQLMTVTRFTSKCPLFYSRQRRILGQIWISISQLLAHVTGFQFSISNAKPSVALISWDFTKFAGLIYPSPTKGIANVCWSLDIMASHIVYSHPIALCYQYTWSCVNSLLAYKCVLCWQVRWVHMKFVKCKCTANMQFKYILWSFLRETVKLLVASMQ